MNDYICKIRMIGLWRFVMSPKINFSGPVKFVGHGIRQLTTDEFYDELKKQMIFDPVDLAFKCPRCGVVQSARSLIIAGAGKDFKEVEKYVGFTCVGRFTGAEPPRPKPDGKPCNWTLGGLFQFHKLEVITPNGKHHPRFEPATAEEAWELCERNMKIQNGEIKRDA
jgi:hypothetical protein